MKNIFSLLNVRETDDPVAQSPPLFRKNVSTESISFATRSSRVTRLMGSVMFDPLGSTNDDPVIKKGSPVVSSIPQNRPWAALFVFAPEAKKNLHSLLATRICPSRYVSTILAGGNPWWHGLKQTAFVRNIHCTTGSYSNSDGIQKVNLQARYGRFPECFSRTAPWNTNVFRSYATLLQVVESSKIWLRLFLNQRCPVSSNKKEALVFSVVSHSGISLLNGSTYVIVASYASTRNKPQRRRM